MDKKYNWILGIGGGDGAPGVGVSILKNFTIGEMKDYILNYIYSDANEHGDGFIAGVTEEKDIEERYENGKLDSLYAWCDYGCESETCHADYEAYIMDSVFTINGK